ncbi:MAG: hypothetical protein JXA67_13490, partial [Micromonosporaceae bacterium]|nr:hypothetical protein [Micromonosporaceae bacterium]
IQPASSPASNAVPWSFSAFSRSTIEAEGEEEPACQVTVASSGHSMNDRVCDTIENITKWTKGIIMKPTAIVSFLRQPSADGGLAFPGSGIDTGRSIDDIAFDVGASIDMLAFIAATATLRQWQK